jgi:RHS repeat-associated protein
VRGVGAHLHVSHYAGACSATAAADETRSRSRELETGPSLKYAYDELGERTKTTPETGPATTYGYDQAGNLIVVERPKEGSTPEIKDTYAYDGEGLRTSQTISGTTTYVAWDVSESVPSILSDGTNSYIYGPGGLPIEQINSEKALYLHHDQQGSTRLLTGTTGTVDGTVTYDAYGNTTGTAGTATTPLGYDGQYTSKDTGLIYLRARTYDPATAQFLSVDPANEQTHQPYTYASDNPLNVSDPTGKCGVGSVGEALESINPLSEENCAYQGTKAVVEAIGANAGTISQVTAIAAGTLALVPGAQPLAAALVAVSAASGAYVAGQEAANGDALAAALDGLGSVLGGTAAAERVLASLESLAPKLGGETAAEATKTLAETLNNLGYGALATSILNSLETHKETGAKAGGNC